MKSDRIDTSSAPVVQFATIKNNAFPVLVLALLLVAGCDDSAPADGGVDAATADAGGSGSDAGTPTCFPLSGPSFDVPDAINSSFTSATATWMRPTGETCPATALGDTAVPFETVCYVNDTGAALGVTFEVLVDGGTLRPAAVIYDGATMPADATQCAAVSSDLVLDVAEAYYTVPDGATVTLVATIQDPGTGDIQFVITPD